MANAFEVSGDEFRNAVPVAAYPSARGIHGRNDINPAGYKALADEVVNQAQGFEQLL